MKKCVIAEFLGTAGLLIVIVGSGIMGETLAQGNQLIHSLWKERFQNLPGVESARFHFLSSEEEFETCLGEIAPEISETIILCDYDLGHCGKTGLDIVRAHGVESLTTMVTNNFQSGVLIEMCLREKIRILPKSCIHAVPIIT